jgi:hypothetical protein
MLIYFSVGESINRWIRQHRRCRDGLDLDLYIIAKNDNNDRMKWKEIDEQWAISSGFHEEFFANRRETGKIYMCYSHLVATQTAKVASKRESERRFDLSGRRV